MSAQRRSVGELLRQYRLAAGLSQTELADRAGLSRRGVSDIERGIINAPHHDTLARLADALDLSTAERDALHTTARRLLLRETTEPWSGSVTQPALVGRQQELALIERHLAGETARLLMFTGEPGIGKSRLLAETAARATSRGWRVIAGGCTRQSGQAPYDPFVSALGGEARRTPLTRLRLDLQGCSWLVRLLPELLELQIVPAPTWTLAPEQERRLMFGAVARYLANTAGPAGTLLLLDDLQWADGDALALLETLVREAAQSRPVPLRLLGAYRATEVRVEDPLGLLLADLAREELVIQRQLPLLTPVEAAALLAQLWPEGRDTVAQAAAREETLRRAEGLPFYLVSSARALQDSGISYEDAVDATDCAAIPASVRESIQTRIAVLPAVARNLLGVAAVIGRVIPGALLLAVAPHDEEDIFNALDALAHAGLLIEESDERYRFAHDLIREVVESGMGSQRRRSLHRRIGEELARSHERTRPDQAAEIATHFIAAADDTAALPYAMEAADHAASRYAYTEAERMYKVAITLAETRGDRQRAAQALEGLSSVQLTLARHSEALATIDRALLAYQALGDIEGQARLADGALRAHAALASFDVGIARFGPMIEDLQARGLSALGQARLYSALAHVLHLDAFYNAGETAPGRLSEAILAAERAMMLARAGGADKALVQAMLAQALALAWLGRLEEALDIIEGALPLAEASGDMQLLFFTLVQAQIGREIHGDFEVSQRYVDRGLAVSDRAGAPPLAAHMWFNQAELAYYRGDWTLARTAIERSLEVAQTYALEVSSLQARRYLAHLSLAAGEQERADALLAAPLALAVERHDLQVLRMAHTLIAERDLLAGRAVAVRTYLEPLLDREGLEEFQVLFILPQYAWALLALGEQDDAEARALSSCERARAHHYSLWLVDGLWVLAMVRMRQARWEEASALLDEAIAQCRAMHYPYAEVKALFVYGQLHTDMGKPRRARKHYELALAICEQLGEGLYRPHVERALAALGT